MKKLAVNFIKKYHKNQLRDDGKSYMVHLENVHYLLTLITSDCAIKIAGLLHDILEDTDCTEEEIKLVFGEDVLNLVKEVTKDKNGDFGIKTRGGWLIKFCDIIDNCTDMNSWNEKRMRKYLNKKRDFLNLI